jgi:hypothetical protein
MRRPKPWGDRTWTDTARPMQPVPGAAIAEAAPEGLRSYKVGVFPHQGKRIVRYLAYTTWYNPQWDGCCEHAVSATSGDEAKKLAIQEHRERCAKETT